MKLDLPVAIFIPRKTKAPLRVSLNLNTYRNLHHHSSNTSKVLFKKIVEGRLGATDQKLPEAPLQLEYTLYQQSNRKTDVANVCTVVDKFFADSLTELGLIEDDNYTVIPRVIYQYGGVSKDNPRVEVIISSYEGVA